MGIGRGKASLNFLVDTVNQSLLFKACLEKEGKLNRGQMICFLVDHNRKMEETWEQTQEMAANMTLAGPEELAIRGAIELTTLVHLMTGVWSASEGAGL